MTVTAILIVITLICGFYVAWNIGANDVANAMGTSVGSGALTLTTAVILAAIFEFAGAYIVGANVSETVRKKLFDPGKIVERVDLDTPANLKLKSINHLVEHGAEVKSGDALFELVAENGVTKRFKSPVDGHFSMTPLESVGDESEIDLTKINHAYSVELNRIEAPFILACGMIASLLAAGTWLLIATWMTWPVSTTHSIVGAVVGFGVVALGVDGVDWDKVGLISAGWVVSPLISGAIAYFLFGFVLRSVFHKRDPVRAAISLTPKLTFLVIVVLSGVTTYKGLKPLWKNWGYDPFDPSFVGIVALITVGIGAIAMLVSQQILKRFKPIDDPTNPIIDAEVSRSLHKAEMHLQRVRNAADGDIKEEADKLLATLGQVTQKARDQVVTNTDSPALRQVEKIFVYLQVITACLVAFAHGSNDVANAIGPLSAAYQALESGTISAKASTPSWALFLGGAGIVIGLATWGWRVIQTVGKRITELTPSRGFCAEFAAAITILLASTLPIGLPISTTHTLVGAVLGVGLARGLNALNLKTMRDIVAGWAITIPAGAGLSVLFFIILKAIFIDSGWATA